MDHMQFLGEGLAEIAFEKAAIQKSGVPSVVGPQTAVAAQVISDYADQIDAPLFRADIEWQTEPHTKNRAHGISYSSSSRKLVAPALALHGLYQIENAGTAIALVDSLHGFNIADDAIKNGLAIAEWPARVQHLESGRLRSLLPPDWELWLDGGHNEAAATALASEADDWNDRPLHLVFGMLNSKQLESFLRPLVPYVTRLRAVTIPGEENSLLADEITQTAIHLGIEAQSSESVDAALQQLADGQSGSARVLICGSLYLAGIVLSENG